MNQIKAIILNYPNRIKYSLIIANIFIILIAVRIYINYVSIEDTITNTIQQSEQKRLELAYNQNFVLNYEKSKYAQYFLQHENNILSRWEFIIRFEKMPEKITSTEEEETTTSYDQKEYIKTPQQSRNYFIRDKFFKIR